MKKYNLIYIVLLLLLVAASASFAEDWDIGGYIRSEIDYVMFKDAPRVAALDKVRLRIAREIGDHLYIHTELVYNRMDGSSLVTLPGYNSLDRCYAQIYFPMVDLTVGRQRIAWGTGYIWNPTDVFNPFSLTLSDEEREGISAARAIVPLGAASYMEFVQTAQQNPANDKFAFKIKGNAGLFDFSSSFVKLNSAGDNQFGGDFVGELLTIGVKGEYINVFLNSGRQYSRYILGADYTFETDVMLIGEYYFNGLGATNVSAYDWTSYLTGSIYQLARDYLYLGASRTYGDIYQIQLSYILNTNDGSFVIYPMWTWNVLNDLDFYLGALTMGGSSGTEYNPNSTQDPTGLLGNTYYFAKLRYSF
ncbi:MAG: hypothetical protein KKB81_05550 [Candidatus Margulisbacteria bacterium]|nr:hypothetical protein [Candidatus Margulisiibacteriota bacterium]MBU1021274.1 hypothetical protein [Candidatus Margulisiibacteriota bacterium]MBU1729237.1 hypothetical protein [Candidatus Margulisiibacteriota bacterium]MBU1954910.1 hypothetical protein [Candidatus Margulisiibacteriota bacterium]